jgi:outer membrane protein TolC
VRRSVAAAREEAQATAADYETAKLSLEAELALDYFELRSADAQKQLLDDTVKAYTDNLHLTMNRFEGGVAPKATLRKLKPSWTPPACKTPMSPCNARNSNTPLPF